MHEDTDGKLEYLALTPPSGCTLLDMDVVKKRRGYLLTEPAQLKEYKLK